MFKAVIFDLDGTLLDTINDLADSMNEVLERFGHPSHAAERYKYFVGSGVARLVRNALPAGEFEEDDLPKYIEAFSAEYGKRWGHSTRPYEGIPELLGELEGRGIKKAVLSNKPDAFTRLMVEKLLARWKFEAVFGERPSAPRKPDPAGALEIAGLLGIPAGSFLYLGDSGVDMRTANAAGMYAVGALWGFRRGDELLESGAKKLLERPGALLELL